MPLTVSELGFGVGNVTENTVAAFEKGIALGASGVEMTARLTADGYIALIHNAHASNGKLVSATNFSDLPKGTVELATAIKVVGAKGYGMNIMLQNNALEPGYDKSQRVAKVAVERVLAAGIADLVLISAFNVDTVIAAKDACAGCGIHTAWLIASMFNPFKTSAQFIDAAVDAGLDALNPEAGLIDRAMIEGARAKGLRLFPWFYGGKLDPEAPERLQQLSDCGIDGLIVAQVKRAIASRTAKQPKSGAACEK